MALAGELPRSRPPPSHRLKTPPSSPQSGHRRPSPTPPTPGAALPHRRRRSPNMAAWNTSILLPPPPPLLSRAAVATPALNPYPLRLHRRHPQKPLCLPSESYPADTDADASSASLDSRPRRIALFVEPSPFAYVSGYKNRFQNFIKYLREMGDEVSFSPALDFGNFFPFSIPSLSYPGRFRFHRSL